MNIIIFGAGRVGRALLRTLEGKKHKIIVIDSSREVCDEVAAESNSHVICGDVSDPHVLEDVLPAKADYIFAVTGSEETNFLAAMYAKHMGAKQVVSRASDVRYSMLMEKLGVEPLIPELTLARELANMVLNPRIFQMLDPSNSNIEMYEKKVAGGLKGITVAEANDRNNFSIISVQKEGKFHRPDPKMVLEEGMNIVVVKHND